MNENKPFEPYNWHEAMTLMQLGYYNDSGSLVHYRTTAGVRAGVYYWSETATGGIGNPYSITNITTNSSTMSNNKTQ